METIKQFAQAIINKLSDVADYLVDEFQYYGMDISFLSRWVGSQRRELSQDPFDALRQSFSLATKIDNPLDALYPKASSQVLKSSGLNESASVPDESVVDRVDVNPVKAIHSSETSLADNPVRLSATLPETPPEMPPVTPRRVNPVAPPVAPRATNPFIPANQVNTTMSQMSQAQVAPVQPRQAAPVHSVIYLDRVAMGYALSQSFHQRGIPLMPEQMAPYFIQQQMIHQPTKQPVFGASISPAYQEAYGQQPGWVMNGKRPLLGAQTSQEVDMMSGVRLNVTSPVPQWYANPKPSLAARGFQPSMDQESVKIILDSYKNLSKSMDRLLNRYFTVTPM